MRRLSLQRLLVASEYTLLAARGQARLATCGSQIDVRRNGACESCLATEKITGGRCRGAEARRHDEALPVTQRSAMEDTGTRSEPVGRGSRLGEALRTGVLAPGGAVSSPCSPGVLVGRAVFATTLLVPMPGQAPGL